MARRSLLTPAVETRKATTEPERAAASETPGRAARSATKPSRQSKLHIGGYYSPGDETIIAFQKLGIDLRRPQQDMLFEAISDFVAKHQAAKAFR
ncbi:MAG: hypothetical protein BGO51_24350 [Rhodospirillales bacterium 69-11]|jgi:hypothetical protein|nr:hypothetical protein [Rhodospirillales bacterium]OJW33042.1 MAG: hypothetical protein BGO51_24350 [Rhodospirillales bacterium 69-11]